LLPTLPWAGGGSESGASPGPRGWTTARAGTHKPGGGPDHACATRPLRAPSHPGRRQRATTARALTVRRDPVAPRRGPPASGTATRPPPDPTPQSGVRGVCSGGSWPGRTNSQRPRSHHRSFAGSQNTPLGPPSGASVGA
jgi:hypothetical protein